MDKIKHFICSAAEVIIFAWFMPIQYAVIIALTIGILKELWDSRQTNNYFDIYDILADILGIILGIAICVK